MPNVCISVKAENIIYALACGVVDPLAFIKFAIGLCLLEFYPIHFISMYKWIYVFAIDGHWRFVKKERSSGMTAIRTDRVHMKADGGMNGFSVVLLAAAHF